jgi:ferredoxin
MAVGIRVRRDLCCGAGLCVQAAPQVYRLDALGYNASDGDVAPAGQEAQARAGAAVCPETAITLVELGADAAAAGRPPHA